MIKVEHLRKAVSPWHSLYYTYSKGSDFIDYGLPIGLSVSRIPMSIAEHGISTQPFVI